MRKFNMLFKWSWTFLVAITLAFGLAGCEGDDGSDGAAGAAGAAGSDGADGLACWDLNGNGVGDPDEDINGDTVFDAADCQPAVASVTPLESCGVCHDVGSIADAGAAHALPPIEAVSNIAFAVNGADLDVTFDLEADGAPATGYDSMQRGYRTDGLIRTDVCGAPGFGEPGFGAPCDPALITLTENATPGNYTIKVLGGAAAAATDSRYLFRVGVGSDRDTRVYFYDDFPATPVEIEPLVVSAEACNACHGPERLSGIHGGYYPAADGGETCVTCHGVEDPNNPGELVPSLGAVAHGYHSSIESWKDPVEEIEPHVTYPTYMNNCSVCHAEDAQLAAVNAMPVTGAGCFSCHGSMESWDFSEASFNHVGVDETTDCQICHAEVGGVPGAAATVAEMHNGSITARDGVIWDGLDTSVTEGAKVDWRITSVADDGTDLTITWEASYDGIAFSPCNADPAAGPVFFADADPAATPPVDNGDNLSILRNYAQGEDFILGTRADRAGQPGGSPGVDDTNTSCDGSGLVATTVVPVEETAGTAAAAATVGRVAIQGKPRVLNVDPDPDPDFAAEYGTTMPVRAKTPTYDWTIGDGAAAPLRRAIADTSLCVSCHVGSLYQHGGNRVDNIDMCMLCHNNAANDEYVRVDEFGVDASESYDGRAGQAFGIKEMVHAVHPARETGNPIVIYRGRGIYGWADNVSKLRNWPTGANCTNGSGRTGSNYFTVVGSEDAPADGSDPCQAHNFHAPTYPRGLYDCAACHVEGVDILPKATEAMATTVEAGQPPFGYQLNDVLEGVQTSSCITCHADSASKGHAYQNSWTPQMFPEGRQTIIDAN